MSELETVYKNETDFPELIESDYKKKKKPQKERATWTNGFDFFLSALGYAGKILFEYYQLSGVSRASKSINK